MSSCLSAASLDEAHPEVRVIIDVSGSMRHNDPDQLAIEALELLVTLVPNGARAGIWTFGERVANPMPPGPANLDWRDRARALSSLLVNYQQYTDIESAIYQAAAGEEVAGPRHLVLLTDGMIDLPDWRGSKPAIDRASREALLDELGPRLAEEGVVVHAIAFSDEADLDLVERLAQMTGGLSAPVAGPDALLGAFLAIVDRIFPSDRVPVTDQRFLIEPGLRGFTALLFRGEGGEEPELVGPDGRRYSADSPPEGAEWRSESRYDLVQVPSPQPGQWRLEGAPGQDSRITVESPLSLQTAGVPSTLYLGFDVPVEAWLARDGETVAVEALPAHLRLTAELHDDSGSVQSAVALKQQEARFVGRLPAPALQGTAQFVVRAEGQGFRRQRVQPINVLPAVAAQHDEAGQQVLLAAEHPSLDRDNTRLYGQLQGARLEAEPVAERRWSMALPELDTALSVPLILRGEVTLEGETRELYLPRLMLFSEVDTAIDQVDASPALEVARFHEELSPVRERAGSALPEPVERVVRHVQALPRIAQERWREWRPMLAGPLEETLDEPRWRWLLGTLLAALVLLLLLWRIARRRRAAPREEPHV
ncbi:VWA domain-containing protein [Halomonas sp. MCCC 1A17488]|uniref:vWA domain-containing protein n=1 Tax=unclassified Halomonas TaxID=2609666 RepID=UPI0018D23E21|nr:vWA domain-containing protein [Halomonas sp. SS10-MC5]MCE8015719.1 VWA domain-containing protein [Halomonas sp. MCCC 1A17488]MCG3239052.1 VWA domain-containing protein [Halomonas sp. MCCC 1A17488]QPP50999.1 VWA domain-containing protein [Halomonas sp. SS10-MC5]